MINFIKNIFQRSASTFQSSSIRNPKKWVYDILGGANFTDTVVSDSSALTFSAYFRCVNLRAETIAKLPASVYQQINQEKAKRSDHPINLLIHNKPNRFQTPFEFKFFIEYEKIVHGNCIVLIERKNGGPSELIPFKYGEYEIFIEAGEVAYKLRSSIFGKTYNKTFLPEDVLHFKNFSNGFLGVSVIQKHANSIGIGLSGDKTAGRFFGKGLIQTGYLKHSGGRIDIEAAKLLKKSWVLQNQSASRSFEPPILFDGTEYVPLEMPFKDAQFLETRKFTGIQICQIFGVPPHKIFDLDKSSYSNNEQLDLEFYKDTILPSLEGIEQQMNQKLFFDSEKRNGFYIKHNINAILRTSIRERYEAYKIGILNGFLSPNDVRRMEDLNSIEEGGNYFMQSQMKTLKGIVEDSDLSADERMIRGILKRKAEAEEN